MNKILILLGVLIALFLWDFSSRLNVASVMTAKSTKVSIEQLNSRPQLNKSELQRVQALLLRLAPFIPKIQAESKSKLNSNREGKVTTFFSGNWSYKLQAVVIEENDRSFAVLSAYNTETQDSKVLKVTSGQEVDGYLVHIASALIVQFIQSKKKVELVMYDKLTNSSENNTRVQG